MSYPRGNLPPRGSARRVPPVRPSPAPPSVVSTPPPAPSPPANCQAAFLNRLVGREVVVESLGGVERTGILRRFDTYALIVEVNGIERLLWKHSLTGVMPRP